MSKKLQISLLLLLFLLPPVAAYVLFYVDYRPELGGNYGELMVPARPIEDASLSTPGGESFKFSDLQEKWTLLYLGDKDCDEVCNKNLYKIHQVRLAQGKNLGRVASVYILPDQVSRDEIEGILTSYPGINILLAAPAVYSVLTEQFLTVDGTAALNFERIYIVDPIGNVMMSYRADADPSGIRKDLKRLLKISQLG